MNCQRSWILLAGFACAIVYFKIVYLNVGTQLPALTLSYKHANHGQPQFAERNWYKYADSGRKAKRIAVSSPNSPKTPAFFTPANPGWKCTPTAGVSSTDPPPRASESAAEERRGCISKVGNAWGTRRKAGATVAAFSHWLDCCTACRTSKSSTVSAAEVSDSQR